MRGAALLVGMLGTWAAGDAGAAGVATRRTTEFKAAIRGVRAAPAAQPRRRPPARRGAARRRRVARVAAAADAPLAPRRRRRRPR